MINIDEEIISILNKYGIKEEETLRNTPRRVSKAFAEMWRGLSEEPPKMAYFPAKGGMVLKIEDISFNSTCEHHLMSFYGHCSITLKVHEKTFGLSKFNRIVQYFSAKPTIQEKICTEIAEFIVDKLNPLYLKVEIKAKHTCVSLRGIKDPCSNTTSILEFTQKEGFV